MSILSSIFKKVFTLQNNFHVFKTAFNHGTITRTGMTYKKNPCYMLDSACSWFIVKKLKYFEVKLMKC